MKLDLGKTVSSRRSLSDNWGRDRLKRRLDHQIHDELPYDNLPLQLRQFGWSFSRWQNNNRLVREGLKRA